MKNVQLNLNSKALKKTLFIIFTILSFFSAKSQCYKDFELIRIKSNLNGFSGVEKEYHDILKRCPDHIETHNEILRNYVYYYTSIPVMSLIWQNMINPYSKQAAVNIKLIKEIEERFLTFSKKGTNIHIPPKFANDLDSVFENNMSNLEMGFILMGAINHSPEHKKSNSAEKMIAGFNIIFSKIDSIRQVNYGFYWEFYADYFISLYKSEHFKAGIYYCMWGSKESEIRNWVINNQTKIDSFKIWREEYLTNYKKIQTSNKAYSCLGFHKYDESIEIW